MKLDLQANEIVTKVGNSIFHSTDGKINGKLIMTNQRVYFKPINNELVGPVVEIGHSEIFELYYFNFLYFFPEGIKLKCKDGQELKFSIKNRDSWANALNKVF